MLKTSRSWLAQFAVAATTLGAFWAPSTALAQIGVSIGVNQPGVYGRIELGDTRPTLIYQDPIIVHRNAYSGHQRPIYMHVPPGHYKQWSRYCNQYRACNQPVYFVDRNFHGHQRPDMKRPKPPQHMAPPHQHHSERHRGGAQREERSRLRTDHGPKPGHHGHGGGHR